jgi:ribosomal protein S18 acetylase RimI-like enzyme
MELLAIHEKKQIKNYLNQVGFENFVYHCNNLEKGFWERTQWFGLCGNGEIHAIAMLSLKYGIPILLASSYHENNPIQKELLKQLAPYLPEKVYCHLDVHMSNALFSPSRELAIERFFNYKLGDAEAMKTCDINRVQQLDRMDMPDIHAFLKRYYPEYLLDEEFVDRGFFYAIKEQSSIISLAGVVAKSDHYKLASIGNVVTHPNYRGKKLASKTITALLHHLRPKYPNIHLNVKATNEVAISCYKKLGFVKIGVFEEVIAS